MAQAPLALSRLGLSRGQLKRAELAARTVLSDRPGRWTTRQVGKNARSVNEVADELGCDWHTVNDAVLAYGSALVDDDPKRFTLVRAGPLSVRIVVASRHTISRGHEK